jgi:hypothetical protein
LKIAYQEFRFQVKVIEMLPESNTLGNLVAIIRAKSDGLDSANSKVGAQASVKNSRLRIDTAHQKLVERVDALRGLSLFLAVDPDIEWTDLRLKLKKASDWLDSELTTWDVTALNNLLEALGVMSEKVQQDLNMRWGSILSRIGVARTLLGFIDGGESVVLERRLRQFDSLTPPSSMCSSTDVLLEAEEFIENNGVGNIAVQKFLEAASSLAGASLESMNDPDVKNWLDLEDRREKFSISFKDKGI